MVNGRKYLKRRDFYDHNRYSRHSHGWPLIVAAVGVSILCTVAFKFVQIRYFVAAWRCFFSPSEQKKDAAADMSPAQALINALNSNLGNGTIAGMAIAVATGGPGAAFWILVVGLLLMSLRFAEVFLSTYYGSMAPDGRALEALCSIWKKLPEVDICPSFMLLSVLFMDCSVPTQHKRTLWR